MVLKSWNLLFDKIHSRLTESISECKIYNLDNIKGRTAVRIEKWDGREVEEGVGGGGKGEWVLQKYFQWKKKEADYTVWFLKNTPVEKLKTVN